MTERLFTVEEANELLPKVVPQLEALRDAHEKMEELQQQVLDSVPTNGGGEAHRTYVEAARKAEAALRALNEMGIVVRDPQSGLIDFPSERDGQEVLLCWRLGEKAVGWWHPPETGFAGRQPL
jgi:hypothetical protein